MISFGRVIRTRSCLDGLMIRTGTAVLHISKITISDWFSSSSSLLTAGQEVAWSNSCVETFHEAPCSRCLSLLGDQNSISRPTEDKDSHVKTSPRLFASSTAWTASAAACGFNSTDGNKCRGKPAACPGGDTRRRWNRGRKCDRLTVGGVGVVFIFTAYNQCSFLPFSENGNVVFRWAEQSNQCVQRRPAAWDKTASTQQTVTLILPESLMWQNDAGRHQHEHTGWVTELSLWRRRFLTLNLQDGRRAAVTIKGSHTHTHTHHADATSSKVSQSTKTFSGTPQENNVAAFSWTIQADA